MSKENYKKGSFVTSAGNVVFLAAISIIVPGVENSADTYPKPIPLHKSGEIFQLVIAPISAPFAIIL